MKKGQSEIYDFIVDNFGKYPGDIVEAQRELDTARYKYEKALHNYQRIKEWLDKEKATVYAFTYLKSKNKKAKKNGKCRSKSKS